MGTGKGQRASAQDLRTYSNEPSRAPEDLFALAKTVASSCRRPRAKESRTEQVQVSYGFLGRKTRTESVTRETETDYWILATKKGFQKREGSCRERGSSFEEEDNKETIFCLTSDGSLKKLRRTQQTVVWDNYRFEDLGWSGWSAETLRDLDHFMIDFDFDGSISADSPGCWRERTEVIGDMGFYLERGSDPYVRRVYPKGLGLYVALKSLVS